MVLNLDAVSGNYDIRRSSEVNMMHLSHLLIEYVEMRIFTEKYCNLLSIWALGKQFTSRHEHNFDHRSPLSVHSNETNESCE
jgi:hypothetical protein